MTNINYTFFRSNQWQFTLASPFDLTGYTPYCTAERDGARINAVTQKVGDNITVTFNDTNVSPGLWRYDVEVNNGTDNLTLQRGDIEVI